MTGTFDMRSQLSEGLRTEQCYMPRRSPSHFPRSGECRDLEAVTLDRCRDFFLHKERAPYHPR